MECGSAWEQGTSARPEKGRRVICFAVCSSLLVGLSLCGKRTELKCDLAAGLGHCVDKEVVTRRC